MSAEPAKLVITGNVLELQSCSLYAHSHPLIESHHVCPESWWLAAGVPVQSPLLKLCPSCHMGAHCAIDGILRGLDVSKLKPRWVSLAQQAFTIAKQYGLTPAPTL